MKKLKFSLLLAMAPVSVALAQVDFTGAWDHPGIFGQEDFNDRGQGPEIGDYLGHRSSDSTRIYAKVALDALRKVALGDGEDIL